MKKCISEFSFIKFLELRTVKRNNTYKDKIDLNHHNEIVFWLRKSELTSLLSSFLSAHITLPFQHIVIPFQNISSMLTRSERTFQQVKCTLTWIEELNSLIIYQLGKNSGFNFYSSLVLYYSIFIYFNIFLKKLLCFKNKSS